MQKQNNLWSKLLSIPFSLNWSFYFGGEQRFFFKHFNQNCCYCFWWHSLLTGFPYKTMVFLLFQETLQNGIDKNSLSITQMRALSESFHSYPLFCIALSIGSLKYFPSTTLGFRETGERVSYQNTNQSWPHLSCKNWDLWSLN